MYLLKKTKYIKSGLQKVYQPKLLLLPITSGIITALCIEFEIFMDMQLLTSFFFIGIFFVFGVVMTIVNQRRFLAIDDIAVIKGNLTSLYEICVQQKLDTSQIKKDLIDIVIAIKQFLQDKTGSVSITCVDDKIYKITAITEILRSNGLLSPELSRIHQYLAQINISVEKLIAIKEYRTPKTLKIFMYLSLPISVFILAPEFAKLGYFGVLSSIFISFLLSLLFIIQNSIEHPFVGNIDNITFGFLERYKTRFENISEK